MKTKQQRFDKQAWLNAALDAFKHDPEIQDYVRLVAARVGPDGLISEEALDAIDAAMDARVASQRG